MTDLTQTLLSDFREHYAHGKKDGIQRGLGMAADIAYECFEDACKEGKGNASYSRAVFDISSRLLQRMKELDQ